MSRRDTWWAWLKDNVGVVGVVVVALIILWWAIADHNAWEKDCERQGGHVTHHTSWFTVYDKDGTPHSDSDTVYYCLSEDGRILDIR